jgi:hypothetical protein
LGKKAGAVHGCLNGMIGLGQTQNKGKSGEERSQEHVHHFL